MVPRTSFARAARRTLHPQCSQTPNDRRTLASAKSAGYSFETGEVNGIKFASRDIPGPTTQLALVARAGTRFQVFPGFAEGLEKFAFKVLSWTYEGMLHDVLTMAWNLFSRHISDHPSVSLESQSCLGRSYSHTIQEKILSSVPNSSETIYHTSPNYSVKSSQKPGSPVSIG